MGTSGTARRRFGCWETGRTFRTASVEKAAGRGAWQVGTFEALWAVNLSGGFTPGFAGVTIGHADPHVRLWTVRLLGDERVLTEPLAKRLACLAKRIQHVEVRSQLAAMAKRLPAPQALPIIRALMEHDSDAGDIYQPLMVWWALESKVGQDASGGARAV